MNNKPQYNTNTATHDNGLFIRYDISPETKRSKYKEAIDKKEEQLLFTDLCDVMIPFWNSIKYDNLSDLATQLRVKGTCRLSTKIVNLEKIGMIKRSNGYLYVNPHYASKSSDIKNSTLEVFNIEIKQETKSEFASLLEEKVASYLISCGIAFTTQEDTLKCINHITGRVLPYDFELTDYKIIIEVQGSQHYQIGIDYNTTEEELEYQKLKDGIKKDYAISNGYKFIELPYASIDNNSFVEIISKCIKYQKENKQ